MRRTLVSFLLFSLASCIMAVNAGRAQTTSAPSTAQTAPAPQPAANPLQEQLKSPDANGRAKAARELGKNKDISAIPALAAALSDPSEKVRHEVVIALGQMHDPAALDALVTASKDLEEGVRILAVRSLVGYYTGNVPTPGFTGFVRRGWQRAKGHFTVDTLCIDPGIVVDPKVIMALDVALKDPQSAHAAEEAAKGLGILLAQSAVADLVSAAHSSDVDLAREALNALSKIKDKSAGPQLVDLLDSPDKDVKRDAMVAVGVLRTEEALPKLQAIFENDPDQKDKEQAVQGLAYMGEKVSVPLFTKALWSQDDKTLRASAAEGLARVADPATLPELEKAVLAEKDLLAKLAVEYALTALGKMDYLSAVVADLGARTRAEVAQPYLIELSRNPEFLPKLYPYLQSQDANVRRRLCIVLMYGGDKTSLEQLDRLSHDPDGNVVAEAIRAKAAIRARLAAAPAPTSGTGG
jgi:HEAT repeat protein